MQRHAKTDLQQQPGLAAAPTSATIATSNDDDVALMVLRTNTPHRLLTDDADDHDLLPFAIAGDSGDNANASRSVDNATASTVSASTQLSVNQIINHTNDIDQLLHHSHRHDADVNVTAVTSAMIAQTLSTAATTTTTTDAVAPAAKNDFVIQDEDDTVAPTSLNELVVEANGAEEEPEEW
jgi:hypothetical protein